jgi:xylulokinase
MSDGRRPRLTAALGVDVGTTEVKAGVVTLDGRLLGLGRHRHGSSVDPAGGRAEQNPNDWWAGVVVAVREAVDRARSDADVDLVAMSVDGHGPTLVPVDAAGRAARPAITWQDTRSTDEAGIVAAATGRQGWGLGILPAARWLEGHEPAIARTACWYLNTWEAFALRLTGRAVAVVVGAAEPLPESAIRAAGLDPARFPAPVPAGEAVGGLLSDAAAELGLPVGLPVVAGVVDAYASLHGARMLAAGDAIDVGGSAGGFGLYWDRPIEARGSFTAPAPLPNLWLVGGAMAATGASLEWFRDAVLGGRLTTRELLAEAAAVPAGAGGLVFLPYLAGERSPLWDPAARGAFAGLTLGHGRAEMTRAILEAAAFAIRHLAASIVASGGQVTAMHVCGGPARDDAWNRIKADVTGFPVVVPRILETSVVGSAILAAAGVGAHEDIVAAIRAMATVDHAIEPDPALAARYEASFGAYLALHPAIQSALPRPPDHVSLQAQELG